MRSESDYEDDYDDYSGSGNWEGQGRNQSRGYGYDDEYNDRNSGSSYSRRGFGSMSREMGSGYGGNSGYGNGVVINIQETKMVDEAVVVEWSLNMATAPTMDTEGAAISFQEVNTVLMAPTTIGEPVAMKVAAPRGYSEDQYLGRGQNRATRYDDDYDRPERSNRSGNRENYRMGRQSGFSSSTRRNRRSSNR
jgi:hypothetical protein